MSNAPKTASGAKPPSRVDEAYAAIKERIMANQYPPGFQVLERQLADDLGMSRTPIREALIRLQEEEMVAVIPRRGMRVVPLMPEDMKEIYEILSALEVEAVGLIGQRPQQEISLDALEAALRRMEAALAEDDLDRWAEADSDFHRQLLKMSGNRRLVTMAARLTDQAHRARLFTLRLRPRPDRSNAEHRRVVEAMRSGDWGRARTLHHRHRQRTAGQLIDLLAYYRIRHL